MHCSCENCSVIAVHQCPACEKPICNSCILTSRHKCDPSIVTVKPDETPKMICSSTKCIVRTHRRCASCEKPICNLCILYRRHRCDPSIFTVKPETTSGETKISDAQIEEAFDDIGPSISCCFKSCFRSFVDAVTCCIRSIDPTTFCCCCCACDDCDCDCDDD